MSVCADPIPDQQICDTKRGLADSLAANHDRADTYNRDYIAPPAHPGQQSCGTKWQPSASGMILRSPIAGSIECCVGARPRAPCSCRSTDQVMNSRCRIAPSRDRDHANFGFRRRQSKQEMAISKMGCNGQFALQNFRAAHDRFGSSSPVRCRPGRGSCTPSCGRR